ncbi:MAG: hypothetical protein NUW23_03340 [Firmicutes bacterium]|jgi:hypothetical protein|nr:hypothetical protein [Bacillota bacterium]
MNVSARRLRWFDYKSTCGCGLADTALEPGGTLVLCAPRVSGWAPPGAVKRFATFPQDHMNLSTERLAEMVVTNDVDETRHATAAFNYKTVCETHDVVVVANPKHAGNLGGLGKCVEDLKQVLDRIPSGNSIAVLLDAGNIFPVVD